MDETTNTTKSTNFIFKLSGKTRNIEFYLKSVNLPGMTLNAMEADYKGNKMRFPGDHIEQNPLSMSILIDEDYKVIDEIYNLMTKCKDPASEYYASPELFRGWLYITSNKNNLQKVFSFYNCWIESFSDIQFMTEDEDYPVADISVVYDYYLFGDFK